MDYNYRELNRLARRQYDRVNQVLKDFLPDQVTHHAPRLLDAGSGGESVLLRAVSELAEEGRLGKRVLALDFVDRSPLQQVSTCTGEPLLDFGQHGGAEHTIGETRIHARLIREDFNAFLERDHEPYDLIVGHASYHEFFLASALDQTAFAHAFFGRITRLMKANARLYLGDPYYPPYLSEGEIEQYIALLAELANHSDPPHAFIHPEELLRILRGDGRHEHLSLVFEEERLQRFQNLARKFYTIGWEKL